MAVSPRVSIVVPVYNAGPFLREAIDSMLAQTYTDLEIVISDDGSTDDSVEIARSYGDPVRVIEHENGGPSAARNRGIAAARGELIAFCDADDIQLPHRLACEVMLLDDAPDAALVAGDFKVLQEDRIRHERGLHDVWLGPLQRPFEVEVEAAFPPSRTCRDRGVPVPEEWLDRRVYQGRVAPLIALMNLAWINASLVRKSALDVIGGFDERITHFEDWQLVGRISKRYEIVFLDVPVMTYRRHPGQTTRQRLKVADGHLQVLEIWKNDPEYRETLKRLVGRSAGAAHYQAGVFHADAGDYGKAGRRFLRSIANEPRQKRVYLELLKTAVKGGVSRTMPWLRGRG